MPAYKDKKNGSWYVMCRYTDWRGVNKQKCQRGFETKRDALEWETQFKLQKSADVDMTLESFYELYEQDVRPRLKENTWMTKEVIFKKKILPYLGKRKLSEITAKDIIDWQNEMMKLRKKDGSPLSYYAFEILYWCGIRLGELLALTMEDFDLEAGTLRINKSYQRLRGQDVTTTPKTRKSNRVIKLPHFLCEEMQDCFKMFYDMKPTDRIFQSMSKHIYCSQCGSGADLLECDIYEDTIEAGL